MPQKGKSGSSQFDPAALSKEQQAAVVELYLGVHPKYFVYQGLQIGLNLGLMQIDGVGGFNGFKPHKEELGVE